MSEKVCVRGLCTGVMRRYISGCHEKVCERCLSKTTRDASAA